MNCKIPAAIKRKVTVVAISIALISGFGIIWSIASRDRIGVILSVAVLLAGALKAYGLYKGAQAMNYDAYEGVVISDKRILARRRHEVHLQVEDDTLRFVFEGTPSLKPGTVCRLYVQKDATQSDDLHIPEPLRPAQVLMGFEALSEAERQ